MKKQIDRFVIRDTLSEGGTGSVYKAEELLAGDIRRDVALKVLPTFSSDKNAEGRFLAELRHLVSIGFHPHIVTILGVGIDDRTPWIAMEYLPTTLAGLITDKPAAPEAVDRLLRDVGRGLAAMHALTPPLLHNDVKPANILIDALGNHKLADFTLASTVGAERTRGMATVRYAAPELLSHEFGTMCPATDLYALGHVAYELALGSKLCRAQFPAVFDPHSRDKEAPPQRWMAWHCSISTNPPAVHQLRPDFPPILGEIIARLMRKSLAERYTAATELLSDLSTTAFSAPAPSPAAAPAPAAAPQGSGGIFRFGRSSAPKPAPAPAPTPAPTASPAPAPTPAPVPAGEAFYVRHRGRMAGPFDLPTLQRLVRQGQISRFHQVSNDRANWRPITTVEGLF